MAEAAIPLPTGTDPVKEMPSSLGLSIKPLADTAAGAHHQIEEARSACPA